MARTAAPRLAQNLADRLRDEIKARLERKRLRRTDLCNGGKPIDERTIFRYLSPGENLARRAAFDLILRCKRLGIRLPDDLVYEVFNEDLPALILFAGEASRLATTMASVAASILSLRRNDEKRLDLGYYRFLQSYEQFNRLAISRQIRSQLESYFGKTWRRKLVASRFTLATRNDGRELDVLDPTLLIEQAIRRGIA